MSVRKLVIVLGAWLLTGCFATTTKSTAGSFITDIGFVGERLYVRDCYIDFRVDESFIMFDRNRSSSIKAGDCRETLLSVQPMDDGLQAIAEKCVSGSAARRSETVFVDEHALGFADNARSTQ